MVTITFLGADAAADEAERGTVTDLVNLAYDGAEQGLWVRTVPRSTRSDTVQAIVAGQQLVARDDDGALVGAMRIQLADAHTTWFGALAVAPRHAGRGVARQLVVFAEAWARSRGANAMQIEVLQPQPAHPHTDRLAAWYGRLGYVRVATRDLADIDAGVVPLLAATSCAVIVMRKAIA
ncbi:MAG: GNAT family N-acetyltransferase [Aquincola sp.]|nr:GNAT family N-acetyltransferase [Aquincola sp.]